MRVVAYVVVGVLIAGCSPAQPNTNGGDASGPGDDASVGQDASPADAHVVVHDDKVYAHSADTLFEVDPNDLTVTVVGDFGWPAGYELDQMTDIALDDVGNMVGISFGNVFAVDPATAACTHLAPLQSFGFNGLSWVEGVGVDPGVPTLVGVDQSGNYVAVDPITGLSTTVGLYGGGLGSSGDLVYVRGAGAFATATSPAHSTDVLVQVDAASGTATIIGETGFSSIWGLAFWGGQVFGFTDNGEFLLIEITTGAGSLVEDTAYRFWGAGVTTTAPIVR